MRKDTKPSFEREDLGINPFLIHLKVPVNKLIKGDQFKLDKEGDWLPVEVELESEKYSRVYVDQTRRLMSVQLPKGALNLFVWMLYELETGKDYLWVNKIRYMREAEISSLNTYKQAVNDLQKNLFLIPTVHTDVFWINPALFFQGSRIIAFPDKVVRKKD